FLTAIPGSRAFFAVGLGTGRRLVAWPCFGVSHAPASSFTARGIRMANLGCTDSPSPGRIVALVNGLLLLAAVGAAICCGNLNQDGPDPQPPAQVGQDDYGGPVWSVTYAPDDTYLAAVARTGDVWLKDLTTGQSSRIQGGLPSTARSLAFS